MGNEREKSGEAGGFTPDILASEHAPGLDEIVDAITERGRSVLVTRCGQIAAFIIPMTLEEIVKRKAEKDPAFRDLIVRDASTMNSRPIREAFGDKNIIY